MRQARSNVTESAFQRFFKSKTFRYLSIGFFIILVACLVFLVAFPTFSNTTDNDGKPRVLVFGGAGYIGSHVVVELLKKKKYTVIVFDNMSEGYSEPLSRVQRITGEKIYFHKGDINNKKDLNDVFRKFRPDVVFHLCALISVHESTQDPLGYYRNNVGGTMNILEAMQEHDCDKFVFSSTAAIFGNPAKVPIKSSDPTNPINPYGETKLIIEKLLRACTEAYGLKVVSLRYFNAAGADTSGEIGEAHRIESHLIPIVLQVAMGKREKLYVFGTDYPTPDGTCIRDYVHVTDIAAAHLQSLTYLEKGAVAGSVYANLGSGSGNSVLEIIQASERVTGKKIQYEEAERREGDPPRLVASSETAERLLGWKRKYTDVEDIIRSAYKWHKKYPEGYGG